MGYTLAIGQAKVDWTEDDVRIWVDLVSLDEAPAFGEPTDHENQRWPSYSTWSSFCRQLGITEVMMNSRNGGNDEPIVSGQYLSPLIHTHPGSTPVTKHHLEFIEMKLAEYKLKHPSHVAQYPPLKPGVKKGSFNRDQDFVDDPKYDPVMCRAEWLVFWLKWSLTNCSNPTFVNS